MRANPGVYASMALAVNAILLPPQLAADSLSQGDNAMLTYEIDPFQNTAALSCPECPSAVVEDGALSWTLGRGNAFLLDFEIDQQENSLRIGGYQLYPPRFGFDMPQFQITQVSPQASSKDLRLTVTGYNLFYNNAEAITEGDLELIPVTLGITSIEGISVNPDVLTINILKDGSGRLMIATLQTARSEEPSPMKQEQACQTWPLLCKWKAILADKIDGVKNSVAKGCHMHAGKPMHESTDSEAHDEPDHPHHPHHPPHDGHGHHGHHGHRHHHHHHNVEVFLRRAFFTILVPILIGVFIGTVTYLVGMALGCLIAVVVAKIRGRGAYMPVASDEEEANTQPRGEKEVFAELPEYESPPVYEETAEKEVVDKPESV